MKEDLRLLLEAEKKTRTIAQPGSVDELLASLLSVAPFKQGNADKNRLIFRGQGDSAWGLTSRLYRAAKGLAISDPFQYTVSQLEGVTVEHFIRNAGLYETALPDIGDRVSWLTLMQHHGAPTRLIDWTWSPFVALYMALVDRPVKGVATASLYVLDYHAIAYYWKTELWDRRGPAIWSPESSSREFPYRQSVEEEMSKLETAISDENENVPFPIRPRTVTARYRSQQAVLTAAINQEATIDESFELKPRSIDAAELHFEPLLQKITIPWAWRIEIMGALTRMGITHSAMFPTLDGLGRETADLRSIHTQS